MNDGKALDMIRERTKGWTGKNFVLHDLIS